MSLVLDGLILISCVPAAALVALASIGDKRVAPTTSLTIIPVKFVLFTKLHLNVSDPEAAPGSAQNADARKLLVALFTVAIEFHVSAEPPPGPVSDAVMPPVANPAQSITMSWWGMTLNNELHGKLLPEVPVFEFVQ